MWLDLDAAILGPAPAWLQAARGRQSFGPIRTPSQRSRRGAPLRLLRGRRILTPWAELRDVGDGRAWVVVGSQLFDRSGALLRRFKKDHPLVPGRLGAFACALTSVESVALVDLNGGSRCVYQPEARQVIQAWDIDDRERMVVTGVYGRVYIHRFARDLGEAPTLLDVLPLPDSDILSVHIAAPTLVVFWNGPTRRFGRDDQFSVFRIDTERNAVTRVRDRNPTPRVEAIDVSNDGQTIAYSLGNRQLVVEGWEGSDRRVFHEHTDDVHFVRFCDDGRLVSADCDNRVVIRPVGAQGYASVTLPAKLQRKA